MTRDKLRDSHRICSEHFDKKDYKNGGSNLNSTAVPHNNPTAITESKSISVIKIWYRLLLRKIINFKIQNIAICENGPNEESLSQSVTDGRTVTVLTKKGVQMNVFVPDPPRNDKASETVAADETFLAPANFIEGLKEQEQLPAFVDEQLSFISENMSSSSTENDLDRINNSTTDSGACSDSEETIDDITDTRLPNVR